MISLCMVVKDEYIELKRCINGLIKPGLAIRSTDELGVEATVIDELVIVTSDAKIKEYGKRIGAKVYNYKWKDDFADARNFAESKATHDVIFWLDADDVVINAKKLPLLAEQIEKGVYDWVWMEYLYERDEFGNVIMRQWKPRLYRKGTGVWKMPIHENLEPTTEVGQVMDEDVVIDHQIKWGDLAHSEESGQRNLRILLKEYQKDPENCDPRINYYIGNTLMALQKPEEAIPFFQMHIAKCGWPEEKYFSLHYMSVCLAGANRIDEAINAALEATKIFPVWSLAYFDLGHYYSLKGQYKHAIEWLLIGLTKQKPDTRGYFTSDVDYTLYPMGRLADAYLETGEYERAMQIAEKLLRDFPNDPKVKELHKICLDIIEDESFVSAFLTVAKRIGNTDRIKGAKIFEALPNNLDQDIRIQQMRKTLVPPKNWDADSVVIYCGKGNGEQWAPPSVFTGIGGSEEAVINMSEQLTKLGHKVTVYNSCGDMRGTYKGVEYIPYYHFNEKDRFATLIAWRTPSMFNLDIKAKKKIVWLHDIAYPTQFSEKGIKNTDKFIFLSKWHRENMPSIPDEKVFISNNGINPDDFKNLPTKRPHSVFWGSSYDRGLLTLVRDIMPLVRREIPEATLDVCYGWDNILREIQKSPGIYPELEALYQELEPLLKQDWINHHGRVSHKEVARIMGECQVYAYSSEFGETNNITSQKAQAAGCCVITTSQAGGTPERVRNGTVINGEGIYTDKKLQRNYAGAVIDYLKGVTPEVDTDDLDRIKEEFSWETTAKTWQEGLLNGQT